MSVCGVQLSSSELVMITLAGGWCASALAHCLPEPKETSSGLYVFVYRLAHFVAANLPQSKAGK
jgi:hypothetical protein